MEKLTEQIRNEAKRLLESGEVTGVVGFAAGSTPARATPVVARSAEEVDSLCWTPGCTNNLALYAKQAAAVGKAAVMAKGCDGRALINLMQEKQISREDVLIVGVPCEGMIDADRLAAAGVDEGDLRDVHWEGAELVVDLPSGSLRLARQDVVKTSCLTCEHPLPPVWDTQLGEPVQRTREELAQKYPENPTDRLGFWAREFEKCVRCYACRQVCPNCYCTTCFTDRMPIKWVSKRIQAEENWMYHLTRAVHLAGRCVECGECERVCPAGIPLQLLMQEASRLARALFNHEAGMDPEAEPALARFEADDVDPAVAGHGGRGE